MINMKIKGSDIRLLNDLFKTMNNKEQIMTLEIEDGRLVFSSKSDGKALKVKRVKVEEENSDKLTIKKDFLNKIDRSNSDEIDLRLNKKTVSSKVKGVTFQTAIMSEEKNFIVDRKKTEKGFIDVLLTKEIIDNLNFAKDYVDKKSSRIAFQGVNMRLKNKKIYVVATNAYRMFINQIDVEAEGEFNLILRTETIETLNAISNAFGGREIPTKISNTGVIIDTPILYFESVVIAETFPDVEKIIDRATTLPKIFEHTFSKEEIARLKAISTKAPYLKIEKKGEFVDIELKNEIERNGFTIVPNEEFGEFVSLLDYEETLNAIQRIPDIIINERMAVFISGNQKIILNAIRNETETE